MSAYKSFVVVGGGTFGMPIVKALAAQNASVVLLSRHGLDDAKAKVVPAGVEVVTTDYADAAALAATFTEHKVDVVISTIATAAVGAQTILVDAAKLAGVKLFVPSEFGMATDGQSENPKEKVAEYIKTVGIPYARVFSGMAIEFLPWLVGFPEHGKIRIVGKGEAPISFTSIADVAGFVAHFLTTLPPADVENRIFRIQGDRACMNALGPLFKTEVEHQDEIAGPMGELKTRLLTLADTGVGSTGWDAVDKVERSGDGEAGSANALWPDHQWKSIKDVHNL
ncbi:hypothetical protein FB451DRAFT_1339635 [Mycena latifolia]|nr:hypothetical protein FB451DRAFT_1339635 [Mycena latifolia]